MKRLIALAFLLSFHVHANRAVSVEIAGTDGVCASYAVSTVAGGSVLTCVPASSQPGAPSGCAATVNSSTSLELTSAGGSANLAASCSSPVSGIVWNWSKNSVFGVSSAASWTDSLSANASTTVDNTFRYQARACNGVSCTTFPSTPLLVTVKKVGGGGGSFNGTCGGFDNTIVLDLNWASPVRLFTGRDGNDAFHSGDAVVIRFTTGNVSSSSSLPRVALAEYNSSPSGRIAKLSSLPCDFGAQSAAGANMQGNSITASFAVGTGSGFGYYPVLSTNTTYYLNLRNSPDSTCFASNVCDIFVDLLKPGGM